MSELITKQLEYANQWDHVNLEARTRCMSDFRAGYISRNEEINELVNALKGITDLFDKTAQVFMPLKNEIDFQHAKQLISKYTKS